MRFRALFILCLLAAPALGEEATVTLQFLGGVEKTPLEGLQVTIRRHTGDSIEDRKKTHATGKTGQRGQTEFKLAEGMYDVEIDSEQELPYLDRPVGFKTPPNLYTRRIRVTKNESFVFNLADACQLTLRAVDLDTGKGLAGAVFVTENALAEEWALPIRGDNLGAKPEKTEAQQTDLNGNFTRLIGPRDGYLYYVWKSPPGYEIAGKPEEVVLKSPIGTRKVEHVFKFKKKQD